MNIEKTYRLANEYYINRKYEKAKKLFLQVLKTYPRHPQANNNLGLTYKSLGKFNEARGHLIESVNLNPNFYLEISKK